jgi:hypothetical protein
MRATFVALVLCSLSTAHAGSLTVGCGHDLSIIVALDTKAKPMPADSGSPSRLNGKLKVVNTGTHVAHYSNRFAKLNGSRAYVNTVASAAVDFTTVPVKPGHPLELDVYWPSQLKPGSVTNQIALECKAEK